MKELPLYGFIDFAGVDSGFVLPVFKEKRSYYSQVEKNNKVLEFIKLPHTYKAVIQELHSTQRTAKIGLLCIYAYYHKGIIYCGTPSYLSGCFRENNISNRAVASFLNVNELTVIKAEKPERKVKWLESTSGLSTRQKDEIKASFVSLRIKHDSRLQFYKALQISAIFDSPAISSFIEKTRKQTSSYIITLELMTSALGGTTYQVANGAKPRGMAKRFSATKRRTVLRGNRKTIIKRWLNQEKEICVQYEKALSSEVVFPPKISAELNTEMNELNRSYNLLEELLFEFADVTM